MIDALTFVALQLAILWGPWPLASHRPWSLALLAAWVWLSVLCASIGRLRNDAPDRSAFGSPGWPAPLVALCGFVALILLQLIPGTPAGAAAISIDPYATQNYLLTTLVYAGAWLLVLLTVRTPEQVFTLLKTIVFAGLLQSIAAVVLYAAGGKYELWLMPFVQGERAMGTFPNPDHLAGYMELCLSAGVGYLLSTFVGQRPRQVEGWRGAVIGFLNFVLSGKMLVRMLMVILVIALVMTHSRMGNAAFFISILLIGILVAAVSRPLRRPALWLVASMLVVDIFVVGQWVGLDRVAQRLSDTVEAGATPKAGLGLEAGPPPREESLENRLQVPRLSLALVADRPWFGHGGGTYYTAFPPYKVAGLPWHWDHAHNDYVQVACDMGLVGLALWLFIGISSGWQALRLLHASRSAAGLGAGAAALLALCCMGLHTMVDFNLHIPANALTLTVLLACVWTVPVSSGRRSRNSRSTETGPQ